MKLRPAAVGTGVLAGRPPRGGRGLKSFVPSFDDLGNRSSSSRRTWIEIGNHAGHGPYPQSSSSRRTWIEIELFKIGSNRAHGRPPHGGRGLKLNGSTDCPSYANVVLLTEDVD